MTNDPGKLINIDSYYVNDVVMIGNVNTFKISHTRDAILKTTNGHFKLCNVLLVPEIKKNILSISQFTSEYPCIFEFLDGGFVVKDMSTHKIVIEGTRKGDLYTWMHHSWKHSSLIGTNQQQKRCGIGV